jgi:hypothetical protein
MIEAADTRQQVKAEYEIEKDIDHFNLALPVPHKEDDHE